MYALAPGRGRASGDEGKGRRSKCGQKLKPRSKRRLRESRFEITFPGKGCPSEVFTSGVIAIALPRAPGEEGRTSQTSPPTLPDSRALAASFHRTSQN